MAKEGGNYLLGEGCGTLPKYSYQGWVDLKEEKLL
jgi:hypothetical protein